MKLPMKVKIKRVEQSLPTPLPGYQTSGSSGMDLYCAYGDIKIYPGERITVPTNIALELPEGYEAQIRSRSWLTKDLGIVVLGGIGTVDSDYRGELKVTMYNASNKAHTILFNDRIAQLVIMKVEKVKWEETNELSQTKRGSGGHGSTGR